MKKRLLAWISCAALCLSAAGCSGQAPASSQSQAASQGGSSAGAASVTSESAPGQGYNIGMTVNDLSNQIFASSCENLRKLVEADGGTLTYLDCKSNPATQIAQVENFISSGVDAIIIQPSEKNALEASLGKAMQAGVKVFCWDDDIQNADICWLIDNYELGRIIGTETAKWVNEKFDGKTDVAILNYPQLEILVQRSKGIVDALKENAPDVNIVAESSAINPTEGMTKTETFLQAHPNLKVIACIGGGGAIGANEAVKASGKLTDDFGIFAADATDEELAAIANNEACRMSVLITGGGPEIAAEIHGLVNDLLAGNPVEKKIYRKTVAVTKENLAEYYTK